VLLTAVVDNVVFHWLLQFHRFKDGWGGSIYVEVSLVVLGLAMAVLGLIDLRHHRRGRGPDRSGT
jgi:hypothetical protein